MAPAPKNSILESIDPSSIPKGAWNAHVVRADGATAFIHTAGQIGTDIAGNVPESYAAQIKACLANLDACLQSAGASKRDIVKLTYYIVNYDPTNRPHARLLEEWLEGHRPSTTLVPVPMLAFPNILFEIEAIAAVQTPKQESRQADVIVIGAGLSGLQAAYDIQKSGRSCIVLEARDRVGGKTWSINHGGAIMELGAAWTNDENQPRVFELAKKLNIQLIEQNTKGNCVMQGTGEFGYGAVPNVSVANLILKCLMAQTSIALSEGQGKLHQGQRRGSATLFGCRCSKAWKVN